MGLVQNRLRARLRDRQLSLGMGLYHLRSVAGPGIARASGHDWVFIDAEHGPFSLSETTELCVAALTAEVTPIVRASQRSLDAAARALDNGAQGALIAMVEGADDAHQIVNTLRYPPLGRRGWGGSGVRFGFRPPAPLKAMEELNADTLIIALIESEAGVANCAEIAAVPGIDALFVGFADLAASLGISSGFDDPRLEEAFAAVARACSDADVSLGMGGVYDESIMPRLIAMGARLVATGNDQSFLLSAATARVDSLRRVGGGE